MATEIERKFLVLGTDWLHEGLCGTAYLQGYLSLEKDRTIRVRCAGEKGFITIKGPLRNNVCALMCAEYEYEIPKEEALELLHSLAHKPLIEKTRYTLTYADNVWEIDVFSKENTGLIIAEIELEFENQQFVKPPWVGDEVTHDVRYKNSSLVTYPYSLW